MKEPIELDMSKMVGAALSGALRTEAVQLAIGAFLEGRGLDGRWTLVITGARLVPEPEADSPSPTAAQNGFAHHGAGKRQKR